MKAIAFHVKMNRTMDFPRIQQELTSFLEENNFQEVVFQVINHDSVKTQNHLLLSIAHAIRRHEEKRNIASHVGIETLLFLVQNHQIQKATMKAGIQGEVTRFYLVMFHENEEELQKVGDRLMGHVIFNAEIVRYSPIIDEEMRVLEDLALFNLEG